MTFADTYPASLTVIKCTSLSSTNSYIKEKINELKTDFPVMILAEEQSRGRGRDRREWLSVKGLGVYSSFAFDFELREYLHFLSLISGLAVIDALRDLGMPDSKLQQKWPNDILFAGKKIAGVLIENIIQAEKITSICGIGINLNYTPQDFPASLADRATSFKIVMNKDHQPDRVAPFLARHLFLWLDKLRGGETGLIVQKCNDYSQFMLNRKITFQQQNRTITGIYSGIEPNGKLVLKGDDGNVQYFYSGEIQGIPINPD